jgi:hypothetical protein
MDNQKTNKFENIDFDKMSKHFEDNGLFPNITKILNYCIDNYPMRFSLHDAFTIKSILMELNYDLFDKYYA